MPPLSAVREEAQRLILEILEIRTEREVTEPKKLGRTSPVTEEMKSDMKARYEKGDSLISISLALDLSRNTVRNHLRKMGVSLRSKAPPWRWS
jgi:hypothetical protein